MKLFLLRLLASLLHLPHQFRVACPLHPFLLWLAVDLRVEIQYPINPWRVLLNVCAA